MKTYKISLDIKATDKLQLVEKLQAFQDLQDYLSHEDLVTATIVITEQPEIVSFIKEVIPEEGNELSKFH